MFDTTHPIRVVVVEWVCVGGFSVKGTPGPVPIPVAKFDCADGTAIVGLWESKTPPTLITSYHACGVCECLSGKPGRCSHTPHFCFRRRKAAGFMRKLSVKSHEQ